MASNGVDVISPLHILIFPFFAQGHILPSVQMAKLLASRGAAVKTTILTTPANSIHFQTLIYENSNIHLHLIPFPPETCTGLPSGCENMSQVPGHLKPNFFATKQLQQLALGLEAANCSFVWVVRKGGEEALPEGFEERVGGRGLVVKGWAPQILILNHVGVGGFLKHCGWTVSQKISINKWNSWRQPAIIK